MVDTLLIGVDISNGEDLAVLTVGRKRMNQSVEIVNVFAGKEAIELYNKLVTVKKKEGETNER